MIIAKRSKKREKCARYANTCTEMLASSDLAFRYIKFSDLVFDWECSDESKKVPLYALVA
jgi:hypothetical protein